MDRYSHRWLDYRWFRWTLYLAFMTLLGIINTGQSYFHLWTQNRLASFDFWPTLIIGVSDWYLWAALTPAIIWLSRRYPFHLGGWGKSLLAHVGCNLVLSFFVFAATIPLFLWLCSSCKEPSFAFWPWFQTKANIYMVLYFWIYWAILGSIVASQYYRQFRDHELRTSQLETQLALAQLQMLRMQLHPHFLFNTLNAISALLHKDADKADIMIARLGELLRTTLESAGTQQVPLRQELEFIQPYLEIEKARLGDRLQVRIDVDPEVMDAPVPNFILQPLVENAIRHGIAPLARVGRLEIRACAENGMLRIEVEDNGPGLSAEQQNGERDGLFRAGVGVANTRARLQQLYGPHYHFEMKNRTNQGLTVTLMIPVGESAREETVDAPLSEAMQAATVSS
jgi:two-component sensor histidine kinase